MGSITVKMPNGIQFKIGSGFSDVQRENPPPLGTVVTFKYNGLTKNGKPRFPVFWRVRD
jgi:DNA ligase-1